MNLNWNAIFSFHLIWYDNIFGSAVRASHIEYAYYSHNWAEVEDRPVFYDVDADAATIVVAIVISSLSSSLSSLKDN